MITLIDLNALPPASDDALRISEKLGEYESVLRALSKQGSKEAGYALRKLQRGLRSVRGIESKKARFEAIQKSDYVQIEVGSTSKWLMDFAGLVSLQCILRIWRAKSYPKEYPLLAQHRRSIGVLSESMLQRWLGFANHELHWIYGRRLSELVPYLKAHGINVRTFRLQFPNRFKSLVPK